MFTTPATSAAKSPVAAHKLELSCFVVNLVSLRNAVDSGADLVYIPHHCMGDCGDFSGDRLDKLAFEREVRYAHERHCRVVLSLEGKSAASSWGDLRKMLDQTAASGVDAILLSDPALLFYAAAQYPELPRYVALTEDNIDVHAIRVLQRQAAIARVVLPQVVFLPRLEHLCRHLDIEIEVIGFGQNCTFIEGQATRHSCASAGWSEWPDEEAAPEPRVDANAANASCYAVEAKACGDALDLLPRLEKMGVCAVRVEADDRGTNSISNVTRIWRDAINRQGMLRKHACIPAPFSKPKTGSLSW
jgi:putative protease